MLMIIIGHLYKFLDISESTFAQERNEIIYPWFITNQGVDIFVLISGFFGINISLKKIINLWLTIVFYSFICALILLIAQDQSIFSLITFLVREALIIPSRLWFVSTYFALMLFSPLINTLFKKSKLTQFYYCVLFLAIDAVFQTKSPLFFGLTTWGGALFHFITLYILGRTIFQWKITCPMTIASVIYIISVALGFFMWDNAYYSGKDTSIWIILPSLCLIIICANFKPFHNSFINWVARSSFGVYCFHAYLISLISFYVNPLLSKTLFDSGNIGVISNSIIISIIIYILVLPIDGIRRRISSSFENYILRLFNIINSGIAKIIH